jgi:hypothetical protein
VWRRWHVALERGGRLSHWLVSHLVVGVPEQDPVLHRTQLILVLCVGTQLCFSFIFKDLIAF